MTLQAGEIEEFFKKEDILDFYQSETLQTYNDEIEIEILYMVGGSFFGNVWKGMKKIFGPAYRVLKPVLKPVVKHFLPQGQKLLKGVISKKVPFLAPLTDAGIDELGKVVTTQVGKGKPRKITVRHKLKKLKYI